MLYLLDSGNLCFRILSAPSYAPTCKKYVNFNQLNLYLIFQAWQGIWRTKTIAMKLIHRIIYAIIMTMLMIKNWTCFVNIAWSRHHYTKYSDNKIEISMHTDILIKQFKRYTCSCSSYLAWVIRSAVMGLSSCKHPTQNIFHSYYKQTINGYAYVTF